MKAARFLLYFAHTAAAMRPQPTSPMSPFSPFSPKRAIRRQGPISPPVRSSPMASQWRLIPHRECLRRRNGIGRQPPHFGVIAASIQKVRYACRRCHESSLYGHTLLPVSWACSPIVKECHMIDEERDDDDDEHDRDTLCAFGWACR